MKKAELKALRAAGHYAGYRDLVMGVELLGYIAAAAVLVIGYYISQAFLPMFLNVVTAVGIVVASKLTSDTLNILADIADAAITKAAGRE